MRARDRAGTNIDEARNEVAGPLADLKGAQGLGVVRVASDGGAAAPCEADPADRARGAGCATKFSRVLRAVAPAR